MSQFGQGERKTELVAAYVDMRTHEQVVALAREEDRSVSAILRRALDRELALAHHGRYDETEAR